MKLPPLRRLLRPALTCLAGVATLLGLGSCNTAYFEILSVSPEAWPIPTDKDEVLVPVFCSCRFDGVDISRDLYFKLVESDGNTLVRDVSLGPISILEDTPPFRRMKVTLKIKRNTRPRVILIEGGAGTDASGPYFGGSIGNVIPFTIGAPPNITGVVPGNGGGAVSPRAARVGGKGVAGGVPAIPRGTAARVEFLGERFDDTAQVFAEDPDVTISDVTFSPETGSVFATITTPANGRTGHSRFHIETAGGQSGLTEIGVRHVGAPIGDPELIRAYPNVIEAGTSTEVTVSGFNLEGAEVVIDPPDPNVTVSTVVIDANTLRATFNAGPSVSGLFTLFAQNAIGQSQDGIPLAIAPPGTPLPRITSITPSTITANAGVGVRIVGENLAGVGQSTEPAYLLPNPTIGEPQISGAAYEPSDPAARDGSVVLLIGVVGPAPDYPNPSGPVELALLRSDGATTNVLEFNVELPPSPPKPIVYGGSGTPARGETGPFVIFGERLKNVTGMVFDHPGITATFLDAKPDGTIIRFTLDVAADAVLTGDAATNFHVTTGRGSSNDALILVQ